ncbi:MAG TPA: oxaloacetate decarboxylase [Candidatus Binatia bacterium]
MNPAGSGSSLAALAPSGAATDDASVEVTGASPVALLAALVSAALARLCGGRGLGYRVGMIANSNRADELRSRLQGGAPLVMPGVFDALSARVAARAGFEVLFVSGYSVSATYLGEPDFGVLTQTDIVEAARRICRGVACPVIVDVDTGYGNALNVMRTVEEVVHAGAAGVFLEDQVWPKRCGHMRGKRVIPVEEQVQKIRAAVRARADADCFIVARTDARQAIGLEEAIARARAYREAGADALFVEAPQSLEELREIGRQLPGPLVANMVEQGVTPQLPVAELAALGFQLIVYPVSALFAATRAMEEVYGALRRDGSTKAVRDRMLGFDEFNRLIGVEEKYALDAALSGD